MFSSFFPLLLVPVWFLCAVLTTITATRHHSTIVKKSQFCSVKVQEQEMGKENEVFLI